jgi:hypothetical protein
MNNTDLENKVEESESQVEGEEEIESESFET